MNFNLPHFRVDFRDWMRGNNLYDDYPSGGLAAAATGYNPFKYPGLLVPKQNFPTTAVTASLKRAPGLIITPWVNSGRVDTVVAAVDDDPNTQVVAWYYTVHQTTGAMTLLGTGSATTRTIRLGWSDGVAFGSGNAFMTNSTNVALISPGEVASAQIDEDWGTAVAGGGALSASVPHPMAKFGNMAYVGEGDDVHQIENSTMTNDVFSVSPNYTITAMVAHRGYLLIAATNFLSGSAGAKVNTAMFVWDGFSPSWVDDFFIDDEVTAMVNGDDGTLYIWTAKHFGYLNGTKFVKLRVLSNRVYKSMVTPVVDGIMYADGGSLVRYSSVIPGGKKYFFVENTIGQNIMGIMQTYADTPILFTDNGSAGSGKNLLYAGLDSGTEGTSKSFKFNPQVLRIPCKVRGVVVDTEGLGSGSVQVRYYDDDGTLVSVGTFDSAVTAMAARRTWSFDVLGKKATTRITPYITISGTVKLKSIDFYYEPADWINNP